jgi:prevent-host-death family protein
MLTTTKHGITIGADFAKSKLSNLLDQVERGQTFTITRNNREIARLVPVEKPAMESTVFLRIRAMRERLSLGQFESAKELIGDGRRI